MSSAFTLYTYARFSSSISHGLGLFSENSNNLQANQPLNPDTLSSKTSSSLSYAVDKMKKSNKI